MEYLNLHRSLFEKDLVLDVEPAAGWTWIRLLSYSASQENGGRIGGARAWTERKWLRVGVGREDVNRECDLWSWDGDDLVVAFYPLEKEAEVVAKRRGGRKGARGRWHRQEQSPAKTLPETEAERMAQPCGSQIGQPSGSHMRKGREGNGKEEKGREEEHAHTEIPSLDEVRTWAAMSGVDPDYAERQWRTATEDHAWVKHGRLVDWRSKWKRYWEADREGWVQKKKSAAAAPGPDGRPAGWRPGDADWWWTEAVPVVERALTGALLGGHASAERLRAILQARKL